MPSSETSELKIGLPHRFEALDSLRGLCALAVATFHFQFTIALGNLGFLRNSYLFVDFFFVLSGFIIAANYREKLSHGYGLGKFMLLRFGRIYPLHFAILMGFVVLIFVKYALNQTTTDDGQNIFSDPSYSVQTFITNVFLLHSFGINSSYSWNIPSWSIATEMWMYLLFGFLAVRFGKFLNPILTGLAVMSLLIILNFSSLGMNTANNFGMFRCVAGFAIGALLFDFWSRGTWPPNQLSTLLELVCFGCAIFFVHMASNVHFAIIAPLVFAPVVFIFANQQGQLSKLLQARCFLILGTLSYSIYMDHALLIEIVKTINEFYVYGFHDSTLNNLPAVAQVNHSMGSNMVQSLGWLGFMIFLLISVSYFTYKFIENPSRLWFRNYSNLKN